MMNFFCNGLPSVMDYMSSLSDLEHLMFFPVFFASCIVTSEKTFVYVYADLLHTIDCAGGSPFKSE